MSDGWHKGNANDEAGEYRGWLLGHFVDSGDPVRTTSAVEVKWGIHPKGQERVEWVTGETRTSLLLMVQGRFRLDLRDASTTLSRPGDYVIWGPGIDHSWQAEEDSVVVTVRWPSLSG